MCGKIFGNRLIRDFFKEKVIPATPPTSPPKRFQLVVLKSLFRNKKSASPFLFSTHSYLTISISYWHRRCS